MEKYPEFQLAAEDLDRLIADGALGEKAKELLERRGIVSADEHLVESFMSWADNRGQFGKQVVVQMIVKFLYLYYDAWSVQHQATIDILAAFWKGTTDNTALECTSSYSEFTRLNAELQQQIQANKVKAPLSVADKKRLGFSLTSAYSKGVEVIGKAFTNLLALEQVINSEPYDIFDNSQLTIFRKTEKFCNLSKGKYDAFVTMIDRSVRNADAHANLYYNSAENCFVLKETTTVAGRRKSISRKVPSEKMIAEIYPKIGWFIQAFTFSNILLVLAFNDTSRFRTCMDKVKVMLSTGVY